MPTTVLNIRDCPAGWQDDPQYVYIGRRHSRYHVTDSLFKNPYRVDRDGTRDEVIAQFIHDWEDLIVEDMGRRAAVRGLAGKTLVCWCKPHACHGDWLAAQADQLAREWDEWQALLYAHKHRDYDAERYRHFVAMNAQKERIHKLAHEAREQSQKIRSFAHFQTWRKKYWNPLMKETR